MAPEPESSSRFRSALAFFENCLETPVIPGELADWLSAARDACQELGGLFRHEVNETHPRLLQSILDQDMELATEVEQLRARDEELLAQWNEIEAELEQLGGKVDQAGPHEAKLDRQRARFTDQALTLVIELRKQDTALRTWYMEAFDRDRGIAD